MARGLTSSVCLSRPRVNSCRVFVLPPLPLCSSCRSSRGASCCRSLRFRAKPTAARSGVLQVVSSEYVDTISKGHLYTKAAEGLVRELNDPYSELFTPKQSDDFSRGTGGRYGGTGMTISPDLTVGQVFPHTPAAEAGVMERGPHHGHQRAKCGAHAERRQRG